ncbi:MAG: DNA polymerase III subunit gamma/tau [Alphaproteobacteria bacterium]
MNDKPDPGLNLGAPSAAQPYRVLARKYRPMDFSQLIGQEAMVRTLRNAFAQGRIAHAFMLTGMRGVGKTTTARIIARGLNCIGADGTRKEPTVDPCGQCEPCVAIAESRHIDVQEMDAASRTGIDDIREIIEGVRYAPASARYKVYIIDEVHMLSKQAFNGLLKTLEEPPPHVKFIFATTEVRKVPVTVLSRCQRFDLRRVESEVLVAHLAEIAKKENASIEERALVSIARAAEGSVRDAQSLLDQAIAHAASEGQGEITAESVRAMLGLADRGRILDLFENVLAGRIAEALSELKELYDRGADPLAIMQDLLETTHFLTRVKVAPRAEGFFEGGSAEAARAADIAARLSVPVLTRAWQMLLKSLLEVRDAANPIAAAEMALIRLAHAADLPPTEKLVRGIMEGEGQPVPRPPAPTGGGPRMQAAASGGTSAPMAVQDVVARPGAKPAPTVGLNTLEDVVALAAANGAAVLKVNLENDVHLVSLERGRIEFRPAPRAPRSLAQDLALKLREWTGERWIVTLANAGGAPTIAEALRAEERARREAIANEPFVRAVLDAFPGAEIVAVRDKTQDDQPSPEGDETSE